MGVAWGSRGYEQLPGEIGQALHDDEAFAAILAEIPRKLPTQPAALKIASIILEKLHLA